MSGLGKRKRGNEDNERLRSELLAAWPCLRALSGWWPLVQGMIPPGGNVLSTEADKRKEKQLCESKVSQSPANPTPHPTTTPVSQ